MKKVLKSLFGILVTALIATTVIFPAFAAEPRDYDSNAIIYGGTYSVSELQDRLNNGSGPNSAGGVYGNWQAPNGVRTFYNGIGIYDSQFGSFVDGTVKKNGTVWVGNTQIASGVFSSGRTNINPSTLVNYGPIPIYWREPKYSFASDSLSAFVYRNFDGSFGYAIVKSCGNAVTNNTLKANIVTKPAPEQTFSLAAKKYNDINHNGSKQDGEKMIEGWKFTISRNGVNKSGTTGPHGTVVFKGLKKGTYKLTEEHKADWKNTTGGEAKNIDIASDQTIWFGNTQLYRIVVRKFDDKNANGQKDAGENYLKGFKFTVRGNGISKSLTTGSDGVAQFTGLMKGSYKITETQQSGWTSTTGLSKTINIGPSKTINFGNSIAPKVTITKNKITIIKFHDRNADGDVDGGEEVLPNWEFTLTGNRVNLKKKTDANGVVIFDNLENGSYNIKETLTTGWENTSGDNIMMDLSNGDQVTLHVGNNESQEEILGAEIERGEVLAAATTKGGLPQAGAEEAAVAFSLTSFATSMLYWFRSKKAIFLALKK
ncbi:hypothetical protein COY62_02850 [bacterium (Candidatus Howlettbacteria) CG_4_10_14_0_8_um_filter_40_9]|nr:MAG: hypothetical protein COY62_02850 [bacterium (Candidatus Howlettbacteria) CG_4_10_14_0_8_um_filter_40_9]